MNKKELQWEENYNLAKEYFNIYGNLLIPQRYITEDGTKLGSWISNQRQAYKNNTISLEQKEKLNFIKMIWKTSKKDKYGLDWNDWFELAKEYSNKHKDLLVSANYKTESGINLGDWIQTQRQSYKGKGSCKLNFIQIEKLESIGMVWSPLEVQWEQIYQLAKEYFNTYGDLLIPWNYKTKDGVNLGKWIGVQRQTYKGKGTHKITAKQIEKLDSINMIWDPLEVLWEGNYRLAKLYFEEFGDLLIPRNYKTKDCVNLGYWICKQRNVYKGNRKGKINKEQVKKLNSIDMVWEVENNNQASFNEICVFYYINKYFKDTISGDRLILDGKELDIYTPSLKISIEYDGEKWHKDMDKDLKKDKLCQEKGIKLIRIREPKCIELEETSSIIYKLKDLSFNTLALIINKILKELYHINPTININNDYSEIHKLYKKAINQTWKEKFELAKQYYENNGNLLIPYNYKTKDGVSLGIWISNQRKAKRNQGKYKLSLEQEAKLSSINMIWEPYEFQWEQNFQLVKEYFEKHGDLSIPQKHITENGVKLGLWIDTQRQVKRGTKKGNLTEEQKNKLESLDMIWDVKKGS